MNQHGTLRTAKEIMDAPAPVARRMQQNNNTLREMERRWQSKEDWRGHPRSAEERRAIKREVEYLGFKPEGPPRHTVNRLR